MSTAPGVATRVAAARVLDAVIHHGRSLKAELAKALPQLPDPRDRALLEAMCFSALRQRARYDMALKSWLQKPLGQKDGELRALLLAGFAQIDAMGLPAHAALSATVEATRALGRPHQAGMVNAVLRRAQREGFPAADASATWPAWLRNRIVREWGSRSAAIFEASAHAAPLWLRVNRSNGTRDAYAMRLQSADIVAATEATLPDALRIDAPVAISALPGFAEGDVSVQDGAAQLVADALPVAAGMRVLAGFATASEAFAALDAGAHMLKLFPASSFGPGHVRALRAVLPATVPLLVVGGVTPLNLADYLAAGADGAGIGGELYRPGQPVERTRANALAFAQSFHIR